MDEASSLSNEMELDRMFRVLANGRRRIILGQLLEQHPPITVAELVAGIVAAESDGYVHSDDRRDAVVSSLHHNHLPKLARAKMIDFDAERGWTTVRLAAYALEPYLELSRAGEHRECQ